MLFCIFFFSPCIYAYIILLQLPLMWQWWKETFETTICSLLPCGVFTWLFTQLLLWTTETLCPSGKWKLSTLGVSSLKQAIKYRLKFTRLGVESYKRLQHMYPLWLCAPVSPDCQKHHSAVRWERCTSSGEVSAYALCCSGQAVLLLCTAVKLNLMKSDLEPDIVQVTLIRGTTFTNSTDSEHTKWFLTATGLWERLWSKINPCSRYLVAFLGRVRK